MPVGWQCDADAPRAASAQGGSLWESESHAFQLLGSRDKMSLDQQRWVEEEQKAFIRRVLSDSQYSPALDGCVLRLTNCMKRFTQLEGLQEKTVQAFRLLTSLAQEVVRYAKRAPGHNTMHGVMATAVASDMLQGGTLGNLFGLRASSSTPSGTVYS